MTAVTQPNNPVRPIWNLAVFALIAVLGLFYVKWSPYYGRAFVAAANHSIGSSILMGTETSHRHLL